MKKIFIIISFLLLSGCSNEKYEVKKITCDEMKKIVAENGILIDVRTESEFNEEHLDNSLNVDVNNMENIESIVPNKDTKIIVYCKSVNRSKLAANILIKKEYKNIYDLGSINNCK